MYSPWQCTINCRMIMTSYTICIESYLLAYYPLFSLLILYGDDISMNEFDVKWFGKKDSHSADIS